MNTKLYVIAPISNPIRYKSRYNLYADFAKRVRDAGGELITVEVAFGDRDFVVTDAIDGGLEIQLRSFYEMWHKENMINLAVQRLPKDWEYVAWVDADIQFARADWVVETVQQLQHFMFVQMFSHSVDLGPGFEPLGHNYGFVWSWQSNRRASDRYENWHPGYAWACRREAYEHVGGLIDRAVLGSADRHMAAALIGKVETSFNQNVHQNYKNMCLEWQARAEKHIMRDLGYVPGLVMHHWHGKKKDRQYVDRWKILVDSQYDPFIDVRYDNQGLLELTERNMALRDGLRRYFRSRNEDSIDL